MDAASHSCTIILCCLWFGAGVGLFVLVVGLRTNKYLMPMRQAGCWRQGRTCYYLNLIKSCTRCSLHMLMYSLTFQMNCRTNVAASFRNLVITVLLKCNPKGRWPNLLLALSPLGPETDTDPVSSAFDIYIYIYISVYAFCVLLRVSLISFTTIICAQKTKTPR